MSDSNLPPERWRSLFDTIGVEFGYRPLANHIGMDHTRLRRLLLGGGTSEDALQQVADAFRVPVAKVREIRGDAAVERKPFTLPDDAGRLTERERDVIRSMVRVLLEARELGNDMEAAQESDASSETPSHEKTDDEDRSADNSQSRTAFDDLDAATDGAISELDVDGVDDDGQQFG